MKSLIKNSLVLMGVAVLSILNTQAQAYDPLAYDYGGNYQDFGGYINLNWEITTPLGSTADFVGKTSTRGFGFDARFAASDHIALGFYTGWNYLFEKAERQVYSKSGIDVSAVQSKYLYLTPLMFQAHYYANLSPNIKPYIGMGIGGYKVTYEKWWGTRIESARWWDFAWSPQAGVQIVSSDGGVGLNLGVKYTGVNFSHGDLDGITTLVYSVGLALGL